MLGICQDGNIIICIIPKIACLRYTLLSRDQPAEDNAVINTSTVKTLIVALQTDDRRAHTLVVDDLVRIGSAAVEPLLAALEDPNANVRAGAARALGKIGDIRALGSLIFRLRVDADAEVRKSAVWAMHLGGTRAVEPLIEALHDSDEWVRFGAAIVLSKIGEGAVEPLITALTDPMAVVRCNAAETLGRIGDARAVDALAEALRDEDDCVWQHAAVALGRMMDARAVKPLVRILGGDNPDLMTKAIKALGLIRDVRAVEPLITVLYQHDDRWLRLFAIEAMGRIGDIRSVESLVDMTYDDSRDVRTKAIVTLGEFEVMLARDALAWLAEDPDLTPEDQQTALFELGKRGDTRALEGLTALLRDHPAVETRMYAALTMAEMDMPAVVDPLVDSLIDDVPEVATHAMRALVRLAEIATPILIESLGWATHAERRMWIVRALGEIGGDAALGAIQAVATNSLEQWWVRDEAREILRRLGHDSSQTPG